MANPQPTDAHGKIAHDIQEQLLIRDFSKQQLKIIYLVIRLSWGCGVKGWQYNSYKDFEVVGLSKNHIEKNLTTLVNNNVFIWYKKYKILVFNKNFDEWTIKRIDMCDIKKLVHESLQNGNIVTELLTLFPKKRNGVPEKKERVETETPTYDDVLDVPKESIKESINNNNNLKKELDISDIQKAYEKNGFGLFAGFEVNEVCSYMDDGYDWLIIEALKEAKVQNKVSWAYAKTCLNSWINAGIKTVDELEAHKQAFRQKKSEKQGKVSKPNYKSKAEQKQEKLNAILQKISKESEGKRI